MIGSGLSIIFFGLIWIRIMRQIFSHSHKKQLFLTSMRAIIYAILAFIIYNLSHFIPELSTSNNTILIITSVIFLFCIPLLPSARKSRLMQSMIWILLALGLGGKLGMYTLSARGEESLKRSSLKHFQTGLIQSMILGALMSGIVFGLSENIIYLITHFLQTNSIDTSLSLLAQRSFVPLVVHVGSLSLGFILIIKLKQHFSHYMTLVWIIGFIVIISSHLLYNLGQVYSIKLLSIILVIIYLIALSYALFRSDTLYIEKLES